ncbi:hypothetical protein SD81_000795 [Tolypothrix campylonemoides VB511288]|nr:hypothetical protein SD81_000795 [Tolypothrix campylonemoides VB511288]
MGWLRSPCLAARPVLLAQPVRRANGVSQQAITAVGAASRHEIIQEILHGREILPLERDRFVNGLIDVTIGERSHLTDHLV